MAGDDDGEEGEEASSSVWQRNILMGGKCQLPDFSGVIIYDSAGNVVSLSDAKTSGLK